MTTMYDSEHQQVAAGEPTSSYGAPTGPEYVQHSDGRWYPVPPPQSGAAAPSRPSHRRRNVVLALVSLVAAAMVLAAVFGFRSSAHPAAATPLPLLTTPIQPAAGTSQTRNVVDGAAAAAVAAVSPGLVDIDTAVGYQGAEAAGTGIVLSADGLVLTNHHVIAGATQLSVTDLGNGQTYAASVVGYDATKDVAVLQLVGASGLTTAPLGDSSAVAVGDAVVGVGNAGGVGGAPSAAAGQVTALDQSITASDEGGGGSEQLSGLIATDAQIEPGDSGGALVSANGTVIGMDTAGATATDGMQTTTTAGFAVPIDAATAVVAQITAGNASSTVHIGNTAFLGVEVASGTDAASGDGQGSGVVVGGVIAGTAAEAAGLGAGDVITGLGGSPVTTSQSLTEALAGYQPGEQVTVDWTDAQGAAHSGQVTLGVGPVG